MSELRGIIHSCVSDVSERIAWSMPFFEKGKNYLSMTACKKHISFYVDGETIEFFLQQTKDFTAKKNAIYFPYDKELPVQLIGDIVKRNLQKEEKK